jgi:hypothetical protein
MYSVNALQDKCWAVCCCDTVWLNALAAVAPLALVQVCVCVQPKHDLQPAGSL